jgi:hypothetical protein
MGQQILQLLVGDADDDIKPIWPTILGLWLLCYLATTNTAAAARRAAICSSEPRFYQNADIGLPSIIPHKETETFRDNKHCSCW